MLQQTLAFRDTRSRFERWLTFHRNNPAIYELFLKFTREAKAAGRTHFGARIVWERIRWYIAIETNSTDGTKLNDHYPAFYSRLVMLRHADLDGFFERRDARFDIDDETLLRQADAIDRERN